jgi:hypothetical protein
MYPIYYLIHIYSNSIAAPIHQLSNVKEKKTADTQLVEKVASHAETRPLAHAM